MHVASAQSNPQFCKNLMRANEVRQELKVTDEQYREFGESEFERKKLQRMRGEPLDFPVQFNGYRALR